METLRVYKPSTSIGVMQIMVSRMPIEVRRSSNSRDQQAENIEEEQSVLADTNPQEQHKTVDAFV